MELMIKIIELLISIISLITSIITLKTATKKSSSNKKIFQGEGGDNPPLPYISLVYNNIMKKSISILFPILVILLSIINIFLTSYSIFNPNFNFNSITSLLNSICILINLWMINNFSNKKENK